LININQEEEMRLDWKRVAVFVFVVGLFFGFMYYTFVGTNGNVEEIKERALIEIPERGWEIMRYEGYRYGSFGKHGGKVWYHVKDVNDPSIQYRVYITLWDGELHYHYGAPEKLSRFNIGIKEDI
jgi:hypothetical protein